MRKSLLIITIIVSIIFATGIVYAAEDGWDSSRTYYYINGVSQKGFVEIEGKTYYFNNNGEFKKVTGLVKNSAGEWKYVRNGIVDFNATGLVQNVQDGHKNKGKYFYVENGVFKSDAFGLVKGIQPNSEVKGNWYYVQSGQFKGTGTGLVENIQKNHSCKGQFYYVENGKWRKDATGLVKGIQPGSTVKGNWYYVKNGQYRGTGTGVVKNIQANHKNNGKYYYVENGRWKKTANGFYHDGNGKNYALKNGEWLEGQNGLYLNPANNKYYHLENGIWSKKTILHQNKDGTYYYFQDGMIEHPKGNISDLGANTGVLVSIEKQHLWFYKDGALILSTPVVTGHKNASDTPKKTWYVYSKERDAWLKGPTWNNFVNYWIGIDTYGSFGIHDSSWRNTYGGSIYTYDGSHGCVNVPLAAIKVLYENVPMSVKVRTY